MNSKKIVTKALTATLFLGLMTNLAGCEIGNPEGGEGGEGEDTLEQPNSPSENQENEGGEEGN